MKPATEFRTKLSKHIGEELIKSLPSPEKLTQMLMDTAIAYSNLLSLVSRGKPEALESLLIEMEEVVRKNSRNGLEKAKQITEGM